MKLEEERRQEQEKQLKLREEFKEKTKKATQFTDMPSEKPEKGKKVLTSRNGFLTQHTVEDFMLIFWLFLHSIRFLSRFLEIFLEELFFKFFAASSVCSKSFGEIQYLLRYIARLFGFHFRILILDFRSYVVKYIDFFVFLFFFFFSRIFRVGKGKTKRMVLLQMVRQDTEEVETKVPHRLKRRNRKESLVRKPVEKNANEDVREKRKANRKAKRKKDQLKSLLSLMINFLLNRRVKLFPKL